MAQTIAKTAKGLIEYRLEGRGPTVMVLNGGHCSRETRLSHEHLTAEGFSVLTPSRPGYDDTPPDVGRTDQETADAPAALIDTLQIPVVDVIDISAAGPTALAFAQRHPGRTRKLILEPAMATDWDEQGGCHMMAGDLLLSALRRGAAMSYAMITVPPGDPPAARRAGPVTPSSTIG